MTDCEHDYAHPVRLRHGQFVCRLCIEDISLEVLFMDDAHNK